MNKINWSKDYVFLKYSTNLFNTIDLESKENNTVAKVYTTTNRAISRCYKSYVLISNIPLVCFFIDAINW